MFENVSTKKLRKNIFFKYLFQIFVFPIFIILLFIGLFILCSWCMVDFDYAISQLISKDGSHLYGWTIVCLFAIILCLPNIFSFITFVKLAIDCLSTNAEVSREIELKNIVPCYELQCLRQNKRFICDTFSKKKNKELILYDINKKKYRLFWHEKYGDYKSFEETLKADKIKIKYFKHSKIIFMCEML